MDLSPTAVRTRRDIVTAAIDCWAEDSAASLGRIARRAGVGRTTLNRYFSGRRALVAAVDAICREQMAEAVGRAAMAEGTGASALQRFALAVLEQQGLLGLIFSDNPVIDPDTWDSGADRTDAEDAPSDGVEAVVARGRRDGSLDPAIPTEWIESVLWSTLFAGHLGRRAGRSQHEVGQLVVHTLAHGVGPG